MTTKHTPGPWNPIQAPPDCGAYWWIQAPEINDCRDLATLSPNFSTEANARLIAAAPEILNALKYVIDWHRDQNTANFRLALSNARAAIAKAEGE